MASSLKLALVSIAMLVLCYDPVVESQLDTSVTQEACDPSGIPVNTDFASNVVHMINQLLTQTPNDPDRDLQDNTQAPVIYGHAKCMPSIGISDCETCLQVAFDYLSKTCTQSIKGTAVLGSCSMLYDQIPV